MAALGSAGARLGGDAGIKEWRVERGEERRGEVFREQTAPGEGDACLMNVVVVGERKAVAGTSLFTKFLAAEGLSRSFLGLNRRTPLINLSHVFTLGLSHPLLGPKTALEFFLSPTRRHALPAAPFATSLLRVFPFAVPASRSQTLSQTASASDLAPVECLCTCWSLNAARLLLHAPCPYIAI